MLLCVIFIFLQENYPFIPIQLSWISGVAIGVPSFLLTLEQNGQEVSRGFLRQVLRISLPAALTMVFTIVLTQLLSPFWHGDAVMTSTYNLMLGGMISLIVVWRVCQPLNRFRGALCVALPIIFVAGTLIAPGILSIYPLIQWQSLLLIPMACMTGVLDDGFTKVVYLIYDLKSKWMTKKKI